MWNRSFNKIESTQNKKQTLLDKSNNNKNKESKELEELIELKELKELKEPEKLNKQTKNFLSAFQTSFEKLFHIKKLKNLQSTSKHSTQTTTATLISLDQLSFETISSENEIPLQHQKYLDRCIDLQRKLSAFHEELLSVHEEKEKIYNTSQFTVAFLNQLILIRQMKVGLNSRIENLNNFTTDQTQMHLTEKFCCDLNKKLLEMREALHQQDIEKVNYRFKR